jgi:hypothetical protein
MAGPALQLFPPPPRPPRQTSPNGRLRPKASVPEPTIEEMDNTNSKPPTDFHELVIQVDPPTSSTQSTPAPPAPPVKKVSKPPRIHIPQITRTPPTASRPVFDLPPPPPRAPPKPQSRIASSTYSTDTGFEHQRSPNASPEPGRAMSPAFSTSATLVRANSSATQFRSASPRQEAPMRSIFPVYDPTKSLSQQAYKPTQASPTHIPRTQISRSPYSPEFYIPHNPPNEGSKSPPLKPFFTPSNLLDNLWVAANGQENPAVQMYTLRMHRATAANPTITFGTTPSLPFYSLAQSNLAGDHEVASIMNELVIQRHHPSQPRVLPISHLQLIAPPSMDNRTFASQRQVPETFITSIFPKLAALQALDAAANSPAASHIATADPGATSPAAQRLAEDVLAGAAQRECCALTWSRDAVDQQTNPWAQHMPSAGSYQLHHPTLGIFPIQVEGDCSVINNPSTRPVTAIYGHNMAPTPQNIQNPASITLLNPYILSPSSPRANAFSGLPPPPRLDSITHDARPISITPSEMSVTQLPTTTDAAPDDAMLARLDFTNDALTLNVGALTRFGNPFLVDAAASTLFAIAVTEAGRGQSSRQASQESFQPPPPSLSLEPKKETDAKAFQEAFKEGFNNYGGKTKMPGKGLRKWSLKSSISSTTKSDGSFDKDIELGDWYGQPKNKKTTKEEKASKKKQEEQDKLPFITRAIISVLTMVFKTVVFVLRIIIKVIAGVVIMITKNFSKL